MKSDTEPLLAAGWDDSRMTRLGKWLTLWLWRIPLNLWRCHRCNRRGCSPIDYPDGATEWFCYRCGAHYWQEGDEFRGIEGGLR